MMLVVRGRVSVAVGAGEATDGDAGAVFQQRLLDRLDATAVPSDLYSSGRDPVAGRVTG